MKLLIAIPAAGSSSRMRGQDKLLEEVDGETLLRRQTGAALATGHDVLVLVPAVSMARSRVLDGLNVDVMEVSDADEGIAASLRLAAKTARGKDGLAILLPDVPGMAGDDIEHVLNAFDGKNICRATDSMGRPGTPIIIPPRLFTAFEALTGDEGGRSVLAGEPIGLVTFEDDRATTDLDTPEAWSKWRETRNGEPGN